MPVEETPEQILALNKYERTIRVYDENGEEIVTMHNPLAFELHPTKVSALEEVEGQPSIWTSNLPEHLKPKPEPAVE